MVFHMVSLLREALFPIITEPVISARTYVLPPALWLSRRFDRGIEHIWVKGNMVLPSSSPLCLPRVSQGWCHPEREQKRWALGGFLHVSIHLSECVCLSPDMLWEAMITGMGGGGVQRPRSIADLPGHLAWLTLFKQVPRRLVSCLVKWLTFWFNQHPRLPDELDHYQKCTGCAMSLTCQNQTHLLIYLLHSSWEEHRSSVWA